jgi:hypothetical protein
MRIASPYCAFDLPDGFVEYPSESCTSFVREAGRFEITISTFVMDSAEAVAALDERLRALSEAQQRALFEVGQEQVLFTPIRFETLGPIQRMSRASGIATIEGAGSARRVASFIAIGVDPLSSCCAQVATLTPDRGRHCIVAFSLYQKYLPGDPRPNLDYFNELARKVLVSVEPRLPLEA